MDFIKSYTEYCSEFTDAPKIFHQRMALMVLSTVVNRTARIRLGDQNLYPNLWFLFLAPSTFYRKSASVGTGQRLIEEIDPKLILPDDFSREGFIDELADHPQALLTAFEFQALMGTLDRDYNSGAKAMLTALYDCPPTYKRKLRDKKSKKIPANPGAMEGEDGEKYIVINEPFLNLACASTTDWFTQSISESDKLGGFLPRFFIINHYPKDVVMPWQEPADNYLRALLIDQLLDIKKKHDPIKANDEADPRARDKATITVGDEAKEIYRRWYLDFEAKYRDSKEKIAPMFARLGSYALKFAMLHAVNRCDSKITAQDMKDACALADLNTRELRDRVGMEIIDPTSKYEKERRRVRKVLQALNGSTITGTDLCRATQCDPAIYSKILQELENAGQLKVEIKAGKTKPVKFYTWHEDGIANVDELVVEDSSKISKNGDRIF